MTNLNDLALKARDGCKESLWRLKEHFWPYILEQSNQIWNKVNNEIEFERNCEKRIEAAVRKFDPKRGDIDRNIKYRIYQAKLHFIQRANKRRRTIQFSNYFKDNQSEINYFESKIFLDILADVEGVVIRKLATKKIAFLAESDLRNALIFKYWGAGYTNDSEIATLLAKCCGGRSESHRKYIQRFRKTCQATLADVI